jgi:uncharacterized protein
MRCVCVIGLLAITLLVTIPIAWGAGFDCARAKQGVEQSICSDEKLSQLDDQLGQSFARARTRAGQHLDALLHDQRNWLAERNAALFKRGADPYTAFNDRILFLDNLFNDSSVTSPLLAAIGEHMSDDPSATRGTQRLVNWWPFLSGKGKVFSTGREPNLDNAKSFPFDPKDVLKQSENIADGTTTDPDFVLFDAEQLGGVSVEAGANGGEFDEWALFRWRDHTVEHIDLPNVFEPTINPNGSTLALYKGTVYALRIDDTGLATSNITAQPYLGGRWGDPVRLQLRYDTYLLPPESYCDETDCTELSVVATRIISRYDQTHDSNAFANHLSEDQQAKFTVMQRQAEKEATVFAPLSKLPDFKGKPDYLDENAPRLFGDSTFFPIQSRGELLLGQVGNGCYDFVYCGEDLLLGIWRWDGRDFTPVLGMERQRRRGNFLLHAWLPADLNIPN